MKPLTGDAPEWILCLDELPPLGVQFHGLTRWGVCVKTTYHPEFELVAWRPLPKLTGAQKARLAAAGAAGLDVTQREDGQCRCDSAS